MAENTVAQAFNAFTNVAERWADVGAMDSEPLYVMREYLRQRLIKGKNVRIPSSPNDWELYTNKDCNQASRELTDALKLLEEFLKTVWFDERSTIKRYLD